MLLQDRTCLVTGASKGIGRGIAEDFGEHGANVVVNYRSSEEAAHEVEETIRAGPGDAMVAQADVSEFEDVEAMYEAATEEFGPVEVLVNNAGMNVDRTFDKMQPDDWQQVIDVNLTGVFNPTKVCFDDIKRTDEGRIINMGSIVGQQGNFGQANYAASKSGIFGLTRTLAVELARSGSTVNCVAPGFVKTAMLEDIPEHVLDDILEDIPMNRFAEVEDITGIVRYLASNESSYMTGQVLGVNGGMYR